MTKKLTLIGVLATIVYLCVLGALGYGRWHSIWCLELNALGDLLAGAVGPLALLWLILGYFQQGEELRQNTEALTLQAKELKDSVDQQRALVEVAKKQALAQFDAYKLDREVAFRNSQPRFVVATALLSGGGEAPFSAELKVTNMGAPASHVQYLLDAPGIEIWPLNSPIFVPQGTANVYIKNFGSDEMRGRLLSIKFKDADFVDRVQEFDLDMVPMNASFNLVVRPRNPDKAEN